MKHITRGLLLLTLALVVLACGRNETMASKSAAAYREAQTKGVPVAGGHEHGGHGAATPGTDTMDHSAHAAGTDPHAGHGTATPGTATMDHSAHMAGTDPHAGHVMAAGGTATDGAHGQHGAAGATMDHAQHGKPPHAASGHEAHGAMTAAAHDQHGGMQHGTPSPSPADPHAQHRQPSAATAHAGHGAMQQPTAGVPRVVLSAPTSNAEIARTQPSATLQPDDFDAPAAIAVEEARKAARGGGGHAGHAMSGTSGQTVYTCPMHPEVTSATPGNCPKCGMALVKKEN